MRIVPKKTHHFTLLLLLTIAGGMLTYNLYREPVVKFLQTSILSQDIVSATNEQRTENQKGTLHALSTRYTQKRVVVDKLVDMKGGSIIIHDRAQTF